MEILGFVLRDSARRPAQMRYLRIVIDASLLHRFALCLSLFLLGSGDLVAIDSQQPITQMHHTAWGAKEGVIGEVLAMAQTSDGFIWVGTTGGLLRFDGSQFERYQPDDGSFPQPSWVSALLATPDGGLWIGRLSGGTSFLKRGGVTNYGKPEGMPPGRVRTFALDSDGTVWAATSGGLAYFQGQRWLSTGKDANLPDSPYDPPSSVAADSEGVWVSYAKKGVFWRPKGRRSFQLLTAQSMPGYIPSFAAAGGDGMWLWIPESRALLQFPPRGAQENHLSRIIANSAGMFLIDRDGGAWMMTRGYGVWRSPVADHLKGTVSPADPSIERFSEKEGLTSATVYCAMEDREGDIWVGTLGGLDRFRPRNAIWRQLQSVATQRMQLVAGDDGNVWASSPEALWDARNGKQVRGSPPNIRASFRDPKGPIWFWSQQGSSGDLWRWEHKQFQKAMSPSRENSNPAADKWVPAKGPVQALTRDDSGDLWLSIRGGGVFRLHDDAWERIEFLKDAPEMTAYSAISDDRGRVWLAYPERRQIGLWDHGAIRMFSAETGLNIGAITQLAYIEGQIWAGGETGLAIYGKERFHTVEPAGGTAFGVVTGIAGSTGSGLWLSTANEIAHIPQNEVSRVIQNWSYKVQYETFDPVTDLAERPSATSDTPAVMGSDGILWVATPRGVAQVRPAHLHRNLLPPQIAIRNLIDNGRSYSVYAPITLPAHTSNLRIGYSVLSFPIPERVRSRYRLLGYDKEWHDGGSRVDAPYNLGPGRYTFQVMARNNDGVWNETDVSLKFTIQPAVYQTVWFQLLYVLAAAILVWLLYRLRLRQMTAQVQLRYAERLAERTRIARDLHDSLLQTIQGSKLIAVNAAKNTNDPIRMRRALEQLSEWLVRATDEGRAALHSLRTSATETNDLAAGLRRALEDCRREPSMETTLSVDGESCEMHPIVRDEVYLIGYEAIRNAHAHSSGSRIDVGLWYGDDLALSVRDNGSGIDPAIANSGKEGHFGLPSMRERAARVGGRLTIGTSANRGTEIKIVIPGSLAFRRPRPSPLDKVKTIFDFGNKN